MNDPTPLLEDDLPEDVARMLRAADEDVHPNAAAQGALLLSRFGKGAEATYAPSLSVKLLGPAGSLRRVLSYTGLFAVIGIAAFSWRSVETERPSRMPHAAPSVTSAPTPVATPPVATSIATPAVPEPILTVPSVDVTALPSPAIEPKRASSVNAKKTERPSASLDQELARIDRARELLRSGKPSDVLAEVTAYRREYPAAAFADEADSLEVRALAALGRTTEARALAERFLAKNPDSPYAAPVRAAAGIAR